MCVKSTFWHYLSMMKMICGKERMIALNKNYCFVLLFYAAACSCSPSADWGHSTCKMAPARRLLIQCSYFAFFIFWPLLQKPSKWARVNEGHTKKKEIILSCLCHWEILLEQLLEDSLRDSAWRISISVPSGTKIQMIKVRSRYTTNILNGDPAFRR